MAILRAAATADFTLDATGTPVLIDGLTLTPANGDYFLYATVEFETQLTAPAEDDQFSVFVGGVEIDHTIRRYDGDTSIDDTSIVMMLSCKVSPNGSQAVEIRQVRTDAADPLIAKNRELTLFPTTVDIEVSATGVAMISTAVWADLLTATTPAAGTYMVCFSSSYEAPATNQLGLRIEVGGVVKAASLRQQEQEDSSDNDHVPVHTLGVVTVDGTEDVVVQWNRTSGSGSSNINDRTMNLIPSAVGDVKEAASVVDDVDSTTTRKLLEDMTIVDPGVDDYLVLFSCHDFYGTIANQRAETEYSIFLGGTEVTDSRRQNEHEGGLDSVNMCACCGGRVTVVGATDDLELFWFNDTTDTRTCHERTVIALREATAVPEENIQTRFHRSAVQEIF